MERIDLFNGDGVRKSNFVSSVLIPQFLPGKRPEVIIWGNRTFMFSQTVSPVNKDARAAFREVFAVVALSEADSEPDGQKETGPDQGTTPQG